MAGRPPLLRPGRGSPSVGSLLTRTIVVGGAVALLLVAIATSAVLAVTTSFDELVDRIEPARVANAAVLQELTNAETGVRGYSLSGEPAALVVYTEARGRLPRLRAQLLAALAFDDDLLAQARAQDQAAERWLDQYAEPRAARPGGAANFDPELFGAGRARFDELRAAHGALRSSLDERFASARADAQERLRITIAAVVVSGLIGGGLALAVGIGAARRIRRPLDDVQAAVAALAEGDVTARATVAGPREVRRVAEALNALAEENQRARELETDLASSLAEVDRAKADFVSNVSHELRTPLTSIRGYLEVLVDELGPDAARDHAVPLSVIDRNVDRLRDLVEDLLTLSRAESRSTDLREVDLVPLLSEVATDLRVVGSTRDVRVRLTTPEGPVPVLADRQQLARAVVNVCANAVKFSREGGEVRVTVADDGAIARIVVADDGIGIPAAEQSRLGTRFFRASNAVAHQVGGTGLGLRIVQSILDSHGGTMSVTSEEGVGTTVTLRLPRRAGSA